MIKLCRSWIQILTIFLIWNDLIYIEMINSMDDIDNTNIVSSTKLNKEIVPSKIEIQNNVVSPLNDGFKDIHREQITDEIDRIPNKKQDTQIIQQPIDPPIKLPIKQELPEKDISDTVTFVDSKRAINHLQKKYKMNMKEWKKLTSNLPIDLHDVAIDSSDVVITSKLAMGRSGIVHLGKIRHYNHTVVIKKIKSSKPDSRRVLRFIREATFMHNVPHERLLPMIAITYRNGQSKDLCLILPYLKHGTIRDDYFSKLIETAKKKSKDFQFLNWMIQLFDAISFLHKKGYTHGDPHGGNVFVNEKDNTLVLGDFGKTKKTLNYQQIQKDIMKPIRSIRSRDLIKNLNDSTTRTKVGNLLDKCFTRPGRKINDSCSSKYILQNLINLRDENERRLKLE